MKPLFLITILLCVAQLALAQMRLEFTAHTEDKKEGQRTTIWAKGCDARMDEVAKKEKMYMLLTDCGKTMIGVSLEDKVALKMPPMLSSPAADINTAALFMQGKPQITVEKLEEKSGPKMLGRTTTYYHFKTVHRPDPSMHEPIRLIVEEEFWTDPTLDVPVVGAILGKVPFGDAHENERTAFATMKGLPLRHRTVVTVEREGTRQVQPAFVQEVVSISTEPLDETIFQIPRGFQLVGMASSQQ